jgi:predicted Zn-ribbon and HTH transcriptional regulator
MPTGYSDAEVLKNFREANKFRKSMGLREIKQGWRPCVQCDIAFFSEDLKIDKRCPKCERDYAGEEFNCEVSVPDLADEMWMTWTPT